MSPAPAPASVKRLDGGPEDGYGILYIPGWRHKGFTAPAKYRVIGPLPPVTEDDPEPFRPFIEDVYSKDEALTLIAKLSGNGACLSPVSAPAAREGGAAC